MGYIPLPESVVATVGKAAGQHPVRPAPMLGPRPALREVARDRARALEPVHLRSPDARATTSPSGAFRPLAQVGRLGRPAAAGFHPLVDRRQGGGRHSRLRPRLPHVHHVGRVRQQFGVLPADLGHGVQLGARPARSAASSAWPWPSSSRRTSCRRGWRRRSGTSSSCWRRSPASSTACGASSSSSRRCGRGRWLL